jgi:hypothetical protein
VQRVRDELDIVETAEPLAHVPPPVLVILPDPEARTDPRGRVLGREPVERLARAASDAGFAAVLLGPGTSSACPEGQEMATGDPIELPALVVYEGSVLHPGLLRLMVAHPLEEDERYALFDAAGRPCAAFVGRLRHMPSDLPITEELPWPEEFSEHDVVRVVYEEDLARAEALVLRGEEALPNAEGSHWQRHVVLPTLRWLANSPRPLAQLELLALAIALLPLPLTLLGTHVGLVLAALALLVGVHVALLLRTARMLREPSSDAPLHAPGERLARATRPLAHAAAMAGLTWALVSQTERSGVAALVLLAAGGATALLALFQARLLLLGRPADVFALPVAAAVAQRLGTRLPRAIEGAPLLELGVLVAALPGVPALPWSVLAASAVARLWRWFAGPPAHVRGADAAA